MQIATCKSCCKLFHSTAICIKVTESEVKVLELKQKQPLIFECKTGSVEDAPSDVSDLKHEFRVLPEKINKFSGSVEAEKPTRIDESIKSASTLTKSADSFKNDSNKSVVNLKNELIIMKVEFHENYAKKDGLKKELKKLNQI